jgi:hypothetical protein
LHHDDAANDLEKDAAPTPMFVFVFFSASIGDVPWKPGDQLNRYGLPQRLKVTRG